MFVVSQKAGEEITRVLGAEECEGKKLIIYFQGVG